MVDLCFQVGKGVYGSSRPYPSWRILLAPSVIFLRVANVVDITVTRISFGPGDNVLSSIVSRQRKLAQINAACELWQRSLQDLAAISPRKNVAPSDSLATSGDRVDCTHPASNQPYCYRHIRATGIQFVGDTLKQRSCQRPTTSAPTTAYIPSSGIYQLGRSVQCRTARYRTANIVSIDRGVFRLVFSCILANIILGHQLLRPDVN